MSVPFFNENPLLQFEQNNLINNYLEIENERNLSIFSNPELENKWVLNIFLSHSTFFEEEKKNTAKFQRKFYFVPEPLL